MLNISTKELDNSSLFISVSGRVDAVSFGDFEKELKNAIEKGYKKVFIGMEDVSYMGSSGVRVLVYTNNAIRNAGGMLYLVRPSDNVLTVMETVGIVRYFEIINNIEEVK